MQLVKEAVQGEAVDTQKVFEAFGVENKEMFKAVVRENLEYAKPEFNDLYGFESLENVFEQSMIRPNTFFEELMKISVFLISFCGYDNTFIKASVEIIGMVEFVYLAEVLKKNSRYQFFAKAYEGYKTDLYAKQTKDLLGKFIGQMENTFEEFDPKKLEEMLALLSQYKN